MKHLHSTMENSMIYRLNVFGLSYEGESGKRVSQNYEVEGGLHCRGISTEQFIQEMNVGGLCNVETGKNQNSAERL